MKYFGYRDNLGDWDIAPYCYVRGGFSSQDNFQMSNVDYQIMLARVRASSRGARPIDIQKAVQTLGGE